MGGFVIWIIFTAIGFLILHMVIKAAINNSVMADLYHENRLLIQAQNKNAEAIAVLAEELKQMRTAQDRQEL
jgi:hypothetical protein